MRATSLEWRFWVLGAGCFTLFALIGLYVSSRTPTPFDIEGAAVRGQATALAAFFTQMGRPYPLVAVAALAAVTALAARANVFAVVLLLVSQSASQGVVSLLKAAFHRARPEHWILVHDTDWSYPSGHATTAIVFYFGLALLTLRTPQLPRGIAVPIAAALVVCVAGVPWSRLALGAHYASDVVGGLVFGAGWLCFGIALLFRYGALH